MPISGRRAAGGWSSAVQAHAQLACRLYPDKMAEVAKTAGLTIEADGSNTAASKADADSYIGAIATVIGPMAAASARMAVLNKIRELGLLTREPAAVSSRRTDRPKP